MTPDDLRLLAEEATPGPWKRIGGTLYGAPSEGTGYGENLLGLERWEPDNAEVKKDADARLIALAPDLARLCAEMGEALELAVSKDHIEQADYDDFNSALAKLSELEAR
jgi:hypothetical protein